MCLMKTMVLAFLLCVPALGETIELKSGEVLLGRVVKLDDTAVHVEAGFPEQKSLSIPREDLAPTTMYALLVARSDAQSAAAHLSLAEQCLELGLYGHAIAEYREAARLDPSFAAKSQTGIAGARRQIAKAILEDAQDALLENRTAAARLLLSSLITRYRETPAAKEAYDRLQTKRSESGESPRRSVPARQVEEALRLFAAHMQNAEKEDVGSMSHGRMREQRGLERRVLHLERAWNLIDDLAAPATEAELTDRLEAARRSAKSQLVDAYLLLGNVFLQRRAIPSAENWCVKACDLDPENTAGHGLHGQIQDAKTLQGRGY